ncbi:MAG: glycerol-3-phosphate 1-O-acyltransferase PlsY [Coriobacteriales bacterium]|nr:glycerol-3-phosphate 1-O-acyltransferase PlsY [Coriobacteriales bacterium]
MELALRIVAAAAVAYLVGGIPFGLLIGKLFYKTDVREHGSGNIGATNVLRVLGPVAGYSTFALDLVKGSVAVLIAKFLLVPAAAFGEPANQWAMILATVAVMLGHTYSPYLRFSGGKGVATAGGAIIVLFTWQVWVIEIIFFVAIISIFRMVSLGSVLMAATLPFLVIVYYRDDWPMYAFAFVVAAIVIWRHRANIGRMFRGKEPKIDLLKKSATPDAGRSTPDAENEGE